MGTIELVIPIYKTSRKGGRPRLPMRNVVGGILYVLATGCQWKAMPNRLARAARFMLTFKSEWSVACSRSCGSLL